MTEMMARRGRVATLGYMSIGRIVGLVVLVAAAFAAAVLLLPRSPDALRESILALGALGPAIAVVAWALLTPALFPGTVLAAAGGLAFGAVGGTALAIGGAILGGLVAFMLARTVARQPVERFLVRSRHYAKIAGVLERRGFSAMLAARLMPGVPASWLHYAAGLSPVRLRAFTGAMAVGALLRTAPYALLGQGLGSGSSLTIAVAVASIALGAFGASALVWRLRAAPSA
jgi:uncharacterized membrane protein YdjX (TVP38/TMEM64 family)